MRKIRFLSAVLLLALALTTSGCGSRDTEREEPSETNTMQTNDRKVAFVQKRMNTYFHRLLYASLRNDTQEAGWEFREAVADYDQTRQNQQMLNFCAGNPDVIVAASIDKDGINSAIEQINEKGVPVVLVDTESTGGQVSLTINFDNYKAGKMAAQEIVRLLTEKYGEPKGIVCHGYGSEESSAWKARKQGFEEEIGKYEEIRCISADLKGDPEEARSWLTGVLADGTQIDAVHCSSDHPARGLVQALKEAGMWKKIGEAGHIIFVTIDGDPFAGKQIRGGYYDGSVVQDALAYGDVLVQMLDGYIFSGKAVPVGEYALADTWFNTYEVQEDERGRHAVIPPYYMNRDNVEDGRHWYKKAEEQWGYAYNDSPDTETEN